ncbi:hypothetical protein [Marivita hallyeonensis]|nr:hypothetical protein [Marivita hallyeonensis]
MDRKITLLDQYAGTIKETEIRVSGMQASLEKIQTRMGDIVNSLALASQLDDPSELTILSNEAKSAFFDTVNALNTKVAGHHIFSGAAVKTRPLPDGETLLNTIKSDLAGATTVNDALAALDTWFETPTGGFDAVAYQGSRSAFVSVALGEDTTASIELRSDDDAFRQVLKSLALAALSEEFLPTQTVSDTKEFMQRALGGLASVSDRFSEARASIGLLEATLETVGHETSFEKSNLQQQKLKLIGVDQFEAISEFEAAQQKLDILYRIAARQGRTSLAEYLR